MSAKVDGTVRLAGYQIMEQLYSGSRTQVYRAVRERDRLAVVIKLLKWQYPTFSELVQFRNQYAIAKNLDIPGIIKPYSLEPYNNGYTLVMEDFGGISLRQFTQGRPLTLEKFLPIAIQLADTLHQLHQQRVIHKDIKPANILIHPYTNHTKLIDFSISTLLPREIQQIQSLNTLEGTLAYLSPEQTGRMNRGIDYRSDFYSLGVSFFELLTGQLPFQSNDPVELVHCHIAKQPLAVDHLNPNVPSVLSAVVSKLMAKNAEDRYQSALGLKYNLEQCLIEYQNSGNIASFDLGQRDITDRFLIPEKLYGRETEVAALLAAFERVSEEGQFSARSELILVAGFSGIGKTAVVNEVHKPIIRQRGYFIKGKYDQFQRNIPLSAFVQAFRELMAQLLSETDVQLKQWKSKILAAVKENGQVIVEVIPELERIIGKQPAVVELSGSAAQNRFNLLFQKFIQVFTTKEHPLVIFLDDLQWADSASLNLMKLLMGEAETNYLLMIGAYRDNEVFVTHPLMLTLEEIHQAAIVSTITLAPLSQADVNHLIADTLSCPSVRALLLTELVYQKTQGNPFFTTQFLKALYEDGLITFDFDAGFWQCDAAQVRSLSLTDDVVEFMAMQLQKLPIKTQEILKLAACIGNQFDLATLAIVLEKSQMETALDLWKALQEGFVIPTNEVYKFYHQDNQETSSNQAEVVPSLTDASQLSSYRFLHDRVQQAAYSLIPESQRKLAHLKIGQLLLQNTSPEALEARIFDIVNQLNEGIDIITQQSEKDEIAQLNLIAGRKAKASTAYKAAVKYFASGIELLLENSWQTHYTLTFGLYRECAECEYLTGNLNRAEELFDLALYYAQDNFDIAEIYAIQMYLKMTQGENIQAACEAGLKGLSIMGMKLPLTVAEQQAAIHTELEDLNTKLVTIRAADLFDLPEMTDPVKKVCISLLADLWAATYMAGQQHLAVLSLLLMIHLSLRYGNAEASGFAYCLYGMNLANQGDYQTAYEFGTLGIKLDRHFNSTKFIYKTNNIFAHTINPYNQHLKTNLPVSRQSFQSSGEAGDVVFGVWAVSFLIWAMLIKGDRLADVYAETEKYLSYVQQVNDVNMLYAFTLQRQFLLSLQDLAKNTDLLGDRHDQEILYIDVWREKQNFAHGINWYCFLKLQLSYFYGRYTDAVAAAQEAQKTLASNAGFFPIIQYHFYYPLSLAALYTTVASEDKQQYWSVLEQHQQIVKQWADNCPENFLHRYLLLSAEMAKISGRYMEATDLYDRAIAVAKANEYLQEESLANELAAKFYLEWSKQRIAQEYLIQAYYGYSHWGAKAKVADLETRYPQLLQPILQQRQLNLNPLETVANIGFARSSSTYTSSSSSTSISDALDFTSILKAAQAISSSIEFDQLIASLTRIILENSGAKKSVLILPQEDTWQVRVITYVSHEAQGEIRTILNTQSLETCEDIPRELIYYVKNTQATVAIDNLQTNIPGLLREYMQKYQPKSILSTPILNQGHLVGIVYLENQLTQGVFTSDRLHILNFLCTQAAISLENAQLYSDLQANKALLQTLADNIPGVIYKLHVSADGSSCISYISSGCYQLYGLTAEELMSGKQSLRNLEHPDDIPGIEKVILESVQNLTLFQHEWRIITPTGKVKWVQAASQPELQADGSLVWNGIVLDISVRKQVEQALQEKSQELEQAWHNLQNAQLQIVQSEKMSALGNLVAGVAHEINNPVGFIAGNLQPALDYVKDTFGLLDLYQQEYPHPSTAIQEEIEAIDLEYIREDLPKLIDSMKLGVQRIRDVSTSLRIFSRADSDRPQFFNLHEGLESTIVILKHRLKVNETRPAIEVVKHYGNIPLVECFPGQINQVFMNILANAIDAIDESYQGRECKNSQEILHCITITTETADTQIVMRIADNGIGMSPEVKERIFDRLFTTKMAGKGTGLGLAIAHQIVVEKHGGLLTVNSTPDEGTEFIITLPIQAQTSDKN
ncbi:AAA family ATPase [Nostoc sp. 106C]|uniref:AAA family ATPase n=1 Tax=Nostoc sp. 106C TaxID=1932667 RepID=UPI000A36745E|nr:AAA family ATPase [Nostoc sp. 106C]OUL32643.1 histidine kinase [Nostoc sp. 106C]